MRRALILWMVSIPMLAVCGDEPVNPIPRPEPAIVFPMRTVTTEASSVETTTEVIDTIELGVWYVIRSKQRLFVLDAPQGSVSIISGPSSVDGVFAGGSGKSETRVFDSEESVYLIQGLRPCKTELILIPVGVKERAGIIRQSLTVSGEGTKPPPVPIPPEPKPVATHVSVAIVEDTMNRSPEVAILMNGLAAWSEFVDNGNDWRSYDLQTGEARGKKAITDLNGPAPGIVIYDKATGAMIHRGDLPGTFDALKALIGGLTHG
jgi:hypothetical protein